ncbi:MAG: galactitol-1-phosphate 5-dehydrogenase [Lachnospiraceae bacterium]|nr:galactitol-1-phosphate 5-dehydrogenase [Lachnospiraceae bacterium]
MKAYVLEAVNDLQYKEVPVPECPEGWALVAVKACGICSSDIPRIFTKGTYHFPTIPGHEFSGVVEKVGSEKDQEWIGRKVGIFPLIPCRKCEQCRQKKYELCSNYDYTGSRRDGAFAEYVAVPLWNLIALPDEIGFKEAAMLEPLAVALHAVKRSGLQKDESFAVIGTGMIGFAVAQWARARGANPVYIIGRSEKKRKLAESQQDVYYMTGAENLPKVDRVIEAVGTPDSVKLSIEIAKPEGSIVLMGNPSGDILLEQDVYWKILRKQLSVTGTWNSSYDGAEPSDWTEVISALSKKEMDVSKLISHTFFKEQLPEGLALMKEHKEPYCKVMTDWE